MATINKKAPIATRKRHPLNRKFKTVEEAARAKTDYLVNVIMKDFDWSKPIKDHLR